MNKINESTQSKSLPISEKELIKKAISAKDKAYAPYSKFRVGAAVIDDMNNIHTGCNVENSSYGATCCAERTAIFKAISEGASKIKKLAVVCDDNDFCSPCGICRQVMSEFASENFQLISAKPDGNYKNYKMDELLPSAFILSVNRDSK